MHVAILVEVLHIDTLLFGLDGWVHIGQLCLLACHGYALVRRLRLDHVLVHVRVHLSERRLGHVVGLP